VLAQLDYINMPIINFVAYFYLTAVFAVSVMVLCHSSPGFMSLRP